MITPRGGNYMEILSDTATGVPLTTPGLDVVYLKFNRITMNSIKCLNFWVEVCEGMNGPLIILSDLDENSLVSTFDADITKFIVRTPEHLRKRLDGRLAPNLINVGAAHMATVQHAKSHNYECLWNIDADDTIFFHSPAEVMAKMEEIKAYAVAEQIDCFSLDMYYTHRNHWSFGMTFMDLRRVDYLSLVDTISLDWVMNRYPPQHNGLPVLENNLGKYNPGAIGNIDWFFTYMRDTGMIKAKSFYIENGYFAHVGVFGYDIVGLLVNGIYHWQNGKLWEYPIASDCIKFSPFGTATSEIPQQKVA